MFPLFQLLGRLYCRVFHGQHIAYAGGRTYRCHRCSRIYQVPWSNE